MTVNTITNKIVYDGNGATTVWSFPFTAIEAGFLDVYYTDADGVESLLSPSLYTVFLNSAVPPNPTQVGGTVTYPLSGSPIATGTNLTIIRVLPAEQDTSLNNQGTMYPAVIEAALDYLTLLTQQNETTLRRAILVAVSDPTPEPLPPVDQRALLYMAFDSDGNPIAVAGTSDTSPISSAMAPVVAAATLALARDELGLGDVATHDIGPGILDNGSGISPTYLAVPVAVNQAPDAADHYTRFISSGAVNFTLPEAADVFNGYGFFIEVVSGSVSLIPNAADNIQGLALGATLGVSAPASITLSTNGAAPGTWYVTSVTGSNAGSGNVEQLIANTTIDTTDNGKFFYLTGDPFNVTIPAAAGFPAIYSNTFYNNSSRGKWMIVNGYTSFWLWPQQTLQIKNINSVWALSPDFQRFAAPALQLFVDDSVGNDANDGLSANANGCLKTLQAMWTFVLNHLETEGTEAQVTLLSNFTLTSESFAGQPPGSHIGAHINGGGFTLTAPAATIGFYVTDYATLIWEDTIFAGGGGAVISVVNQNAICDFGTDVVWGSNATGIGCNITAGGIVNLTGINTFAGNCANFFTLSNGGSLLIGGLAYPVPGALNFTEFVSYFGTGTRVYVNPGTTFTGAGSGAGSAGKRYTGDYLAQLILNGATFPGNAAGTVANGAYVL